MWQAHGGLFVAMSALGDRLKAAGRDCGLTSNRKIAAAAGVSAPTVDRIIKGNVDTRVENLDAVAKAVGVGITEARRLAGLPQGEPGAYIGPEESRLLNRRQRTAIDELIKAIVQGEAAPASETVVKARPTRVRPVPPADPGTATGAPAADARHVRDPESPDGEES